MAPVSSWLLDLIGAQPTRADGSGSVVFSATFAVAAAGDRGNGRDAAGDGTHRRRSCVLHGAPIAMLYAANTFGAVLGVLAAAFVWCRASGLSITAAMCIATNFACAALALKVFAPRRRDRTAARG